MLSNKQEQIITTNARKVIVIASAASGKTTVLVERTKYLLQSGINPNEIVVITFTNAAAEELSERLNHPRGVFIGTIHGYCNYLLLSGGYDTSDILENEDFDRLFTKIKKHLNCIRPVKHLLLDESQDSTPQQFEFLLDMVNPQNYMLVGDHKQSIYRWNHADPQYLIDLSHNDDVVTYDLNENYRNGSKILDYAKGIIKMAGLDYMDNSIPMRNVTGKVIDIPYSPQAIARSIKQYGNYKDWFVLTRTNSQADEMMEVLRANGVPCDTFKRSQLDNHETYQKMQEDTVKVLTIHVSKGLECKNVVVVGAKFYNIEEKCISYVAATRARDLLVWTRLPVKKQKNMVNWET